MIIQGEKSKSSISHIFVCGNDATLPQLKLFLSTLRCSEKGNYHGKVTLLSDQLGDWSKAWLKNENVDFFVGDHSNLLPQKLAEKIAIFEAAKFPLPAPFWGALLKFVAKVGSFIPAKRRWYKGDDRRSFQLRLKIFSFLLPRIGLVATYADKVFLIWRRKHLSKFLLLQYMAREGSAHVNDMVGLLDSDLIFQDSVVRLSEECSNSKVNVALEEYESLCIFPNPSPVYWSNLIARDFDFFEDLEFGEYAHEVNIGVTIGSSDLIQKMLSDLLSLMTRKNYFGLWTAHEQHFWHEQDFFRLLYCQKEYFGVLTPDVVYHACGRAGDLLHEEQQGDDSKYYIIKNERRIFPNIVHFAGQKRRKFQKIMAAYSSEALSMES